MKKALFVSTLAIATMVTAAAFACGGGKGGGHGARIDTNGDGKITVAESQAAAKARFDMLDKNKDGSITQAEVQGRAKHLFENADANKDGKVTLAEMQAKARAFFTARDTNKDNVLSGDELGHMGRGHGKKGEQRS